MYYFGTKGSSLIASQIDISVDEAFKHEVAEVWLRSVVEMALGVAFAEGETCQVSLAVTCDETVHALNREYRGLDEGTDVLSFSPSHQGHWEGETKFPEVDNGKTAAPGRPAFVYPPGEAAPLGEVVIAFPQAKRQALEHSVPLEQELALLIVHGVLHLAGHDHLEPMEQMKMQEKEQAALGAMPQAAISQDRIL